MEALCPDCNTELTPSIVGYLCHGCGSVHSFNKVSSSVKTGQNNQSHKVSLKEDLNQKSSRSVFANKDLPKPEKVKFRHKIKKAFVPEISKR